MLLCSGVDRDINYIPRKARERTMGNNRDQEPLPLPKVIGLKVKNCQEKKNDEKKSLTVGQIFVTSIPRTFFFLAKDEISLVGQVGDLTDSSQTFHKAPLKQLLPRTKPSTYPRTHREEGWIRD